jgi:hypothetical protein
MIFGASYKTGIVMRRRDIIDSVETNKEVILNIADTVLKYKKSQELNKRDIKLQTLEDYRKTTRKTLISQITKFMFGDSATLSRAHQKTILDWCLEDDERYSEFPGIEKLFKNWSPKASSLKKLGRYTEETAFFAIDYVAEYNKGAKDIHFDTFCRTKIIPEFAKKFNRNIGIRSLKRLNTFWKGGSNQTKKEVARHAHLMDFVNNYKIKDSVNATSVITPKDSKFRGLAEFLTKISMLPIPEETNFSLDDLLQLTKLSTELNKPEIINKLETVIRILSKDFLIPRLEKHIEHVTK